MRKAGIALLESLLRLRAAAPARARELPAEADIAAIEAATVDPLVRVSTRAPPLSAHRTLLKCSSRVLSTCGQLLFANCTLEHLDARQWWSASPDELQRVVTSHVRSQNKQEVYRR